MLVVHIFVHVKPEYIGAFQQATMENGSQSVKEPGIARFEVIQQTDDPSRFIFTEAYRDSQAALAHKETAHYLKWRDAVAPMMAEPRTRVECTAVFPLDEDW